MPSKMLETLGKGRLHATDTEATYPEGHRLEGLRSEGQALGFAAKWEGLRRRWGREGGFDGRQAAEREEGVLGDGHGFELGKYPMVETTVRDLENGDRSGVAETRFVGIANGGANRSESSRYQAGGSNWVEI